MKSWQEDLLATMDRIHDEHVLFAKVCAAAQELGFEYSAYGLRLLMPVASPKTRMLNNYPAAWQARYATMGYLEIDPTVLHARRSETPIVWSNEVFADTMDFWDDAQAHGLRVGWAKSNLSLPGVGGMLTLARSHDELTSQELRSIETNMRWLSHTAHACFSRLLRPQLEKQPRVVLTDREIEVLRWTADGKTSADISDLLSISLNTVNFHIKNAISKLVVSNKTAAVVRAALMGLLF